MTISSTNRKAGPYAGNDVATAFPFSFKVFTASDLYVVRADSSGTETVLALTTGYTVSLNADQNANPGGTVTLLSALATGYLLTITSRIDYLQPTDLTNQGGFYPKVITNALDRLTIFCQQLAEQMGRTLKYAITSPLGDSALPAPIANYIIGWNETANGFKNFAPADNTLLSASLAASNGSALVGFKQSGTGAATRTIFAKLGETLSAEDFGAVGNLIADDSAAILAGVNALSVGPLHLPKGPYNFALTIPANKGVMSYTECASKDVWYWGRNMSGAKSTGAGSANLGYGPAGFQFDLRSDTADCGADFMRALYGRTVFGGSTVKGGRNGVLGEVIHQLGATNSANANRNYVGMVGTAHSENGDGGSDSTTNAKGAYFGLNGIGRAAAGATNIFEVAGCELNTYVGAGSSMRYLFGATIAGFNMVHGSEIEAALEIGGGTDSGYGPHVGWNNGILFSNIHGSDPTNANTTLIGAYFQGGGGLRTIKAGLDTSLFNCSSGIVLGPNLVLTDNQLSLGVNGANISAIKAGNNVTAANLDLMPKGGGAIRLYDNIGGTVRMFVDNGNGIRMVPMASATPQANGELAVQATSNTSLTFKFKGSDGTVRSNSLTLA